MKCAPYCVLIITGHQLIDRMSGQLNNVSIQNVMKPIKVCTPLCPQVYHIIKFPHHMIKFKYHIIKFTPYIIKFPHHIIRFPYHIIKFTNHLKS